MVFRRIIQSLFPSSHTARGQRGQPRTPVVQTSERLIRIDGLKPLDPLQPSTLTHFNMLMEEVLRDRSVEEGAKIARAPAPEAPPHLHRGPCNQKFQMLMLEWATIRLEIDRQGAAGIAEEQRLKRALGEWISRRNALRAMPVMVPATLQAMHEDFRRAVLILDSIERRNLTTLTGAVIRFHHLRRQLHIGLR